MKAKLECTHPAATRHLIQRKPGPPLRPPRPPRQRPLAQCRRVHLAERRLPASSTTRIPLPAHTGSPKPTRKLLLHRRFPRLSELWKWGKFSKQKNKDTSSDKPQSSSGGSGTDRGPTPSQHNSHRYSVSFQASSDLPGISCPGRF